MRLERTGANANIRIKRDDHLIQELHEKIIPEQCAL